MINIPVSTGEVIDKITILEIKLDKITDNDKLKNVSNELNYLKKLIDCNSVQDLYNELREINLTLWDIEDRLRIKESKSEFDDSFIELARQVYFTNDKRAAIKKQINLHTNSELVEEKQYVDY